MTLRAVRTGFLSRGYRFLSGDQEVGRLTLGLLGRRGAIEVGDQQFRIRREGVVGDFVLEQADVPHARELARASGGRPFSRTFRIRAADRALTLSGGVLGLRTLRLRHGDREVGLARREGWRGRAARFEFPDELPLEIQIFLGALALHRWRRARAAAAG